VTLRTKVEVFPNESRGLPKRPDFWTCRTWKRYLRRVCPPLGAVFGSAESSFRWGNSRRPAPGRALPGFDRRAAFRADRRRVGPMKGTQIWDEVE